MRISLANFERVFDSLGQQNSEMIQRGGELETTQYLNRCETSVALCPDRHSDAVLRRLLECAKRCGRATGSRTSRSKRSKVRFVVFDANLTRPEWYAVLLENALQHEITEHLRALSECMT